MKPSRLKWICLAIEYEKLHSGESKHLFSLMEDSIGGKLITEAAERKLEEIFKEVQWRESVPVKKDATESVP